MPAHVSPSSSCSSESIHELDLEEDKEWEDAEADEEKINVICLFGEKSFGHINAMLEHCRYVHDCDIVQIQKELDLDFLQMIKMINYIRSEVQRGNETPDLSSREAFQEERYLKPFLEQDALLYSLDDVIGPLDQAAPGTINGILGESSGESSWKEDMARNRIAELQEELHRLQKQFSAYRETVDQTLENRWNNEGNGTADARNGLAQSGIKTAPRDDDTHYFSSYSFNDIHETMLKDEVRTDAYRDFIYDNKNLFKEKIILDVGCGTGILSMFCARAGAAKVIAVDNSDIIDRARENIHDNALDDIITCLRGKVEEVTLPVPHVDIIVSEWMGYCLLYEAMLDSVLWARDRYLVPGGLMIPSHMTLHIAPFADPDFIAEHITFWHSVYGFQMTSMLAHIRDEVFIQHLKPSSLPASSYPFLQLPLHSVTKEVLTFANQSFTLTLTQDIDALDGFVIWFDAFFQLSSEHTVPPTAKAEHWARSNGGGGGGGGGVAFSTGPAGRDTHWRQGILLIDHGKQVPPTLQTGQTIEGTVGYKKREDNSRELDIEIQWRLPGADAAAAAAEKGKEKEKEDEGKEKEKEKEEGGKQIWFMR